MFLLEGKEVATVSRSFEGLEDILLLPTTSLRLHGRNEGTGTFLHSGTPHLTRRGLLDI